MNANIASNSQESLSHKAKTGQIPARRVWCMLLIRSLLPFAMLLLLAAVYKFMGSDSAIADASAWWLWFVTIVNCVCIALLVKFSRLENVTLPELVFWNRASWKGDLVWLLIAVAGTLVMASWPANFLARMFWGDPAYPNALLIRPLPVLAIYPLFLLMPVTQGLAELPTYWAYAAPRLRASGMRRWLVILLVGLLLSLQHMFFSFQLDLRYDLWLAFKFLPFALWTGFIVDRRPTVLPYLMLFHVLLDASLPILTLLVTKGMPLS